MSSWKDCASSIAHMPYSDDDSDAVNDQSNVVLTSHRFKLNSDVEGNLVCDANGNIDSHEDSDDTEPVMMLSCKSFSSGMHKMVQTGGSCSELLPSVQCSNVLPEDKLTSALWSSDTNRHDRTLSSDSSAACKKICASFCGKILHLQDDCEVSKWTTSPSVKPVSDSTLNIHDTFETCKEISTRLLSSTSDSDVHSGLLSNAQDVRLNNRKDPAASPVSSPIATKPPSSILVSNLTHNNGDIPSLYGQEPYKPSKSVALKGNAASKSTVSSESYLDVPSSSAKEISNGREKLATDSSKKLESALYNGNCSIPPGKKTIHRSRHAGRKSRTKSKSMSETVELKLKVTHRPEPCQLVSCTPLINNSVLDIAPLQGAEEIASSTVESDETDNTGEDLINCNTATGSDETDLQPLVSVNSHPKRSLAKTMSVCLDDTMSPLPHQRVRCYGYEYDSEPIHMTLEEVKTSLQRLYGQKGLTMPDAKPTIASSSPSTSNHNCYLKSISKTPPKKTGAFHIHLRPKKGKDGTTEAETKERLQNRKSFPSSIKQTFCSLFGTTKKSMAVSLTGTDDDDDNELPVSVTNRVHSKSSEELSSRHEDDAVSPNLLNTPSRSIPSLSPFVNRALPPLPLTQNGEQLLVDGTTDLEDVTINNDDWDKVDDEPLDFTASIQQVKDYGWYWGPISGEMAEKILINEPDGSFIVRDSSDEHYIFSLTFKLNGLVRHVRIEHDQGNFSFGTFTNFKSQTIVGFIENAVKHSRSGRYLFFLHRRPVLGPMRVQLLHPVSRFKQVQSLQHMCRFVILKAVRRDLIYSLPLPKRLKDYLNTPQYYTEDVDGASDDDHMAWQIHPAVTPEQNLLHGAMPETDR